MARQYWDPFTDLEGLHREIDRLFDEAFGTDGGSSRPFSRTSFLPGRAARAYPLMNLSEDNENLYIEALAPGIDPDSLTLTVTNNQMTLSGEKKAAPQEFKSESWHRNERSTGRFLRTVNLPSHIQEDRISADYRNGLLLMTLPKAEKAKPRQIAVKA